MTTFLIERKVEELFFTLLVLNQVVHISTPRT